ncbi:CDP-archaeol synthase [uncultured Thermanaerothrix sp.]|uniref:phosphatidate cytidylyltransferase n=1 Tax=uncultured Thermanaerothrix sp. TaxID=1195149 RepID=UPI0026317DA9|nr:CDP-archaeol synthase [uncultured Thermanaerothrix sp.]
MLAQRLLVIIILIPIGVTFAVLGGWPYAAFIALILVVAAWEYWRIFRRGGFAPLASVLLPGVALLVFSRAAWGFDYSHLILSALILVTMLAHMVAMAATHTAQGVDFAITLGGLLYIGWLGSYLISLRALPQGLWWLLLVIPIIGIADSAAFLIGRRFGQHKLAPAISPNKTWEGYLAGVVFAILSGLLLAWLWQLRYPALQPSQGLILGVIIGTLAPLGDLGESMFKRQFGVKEASHLLPGHGGILDRIDSWIWAAVIGYYLITGLWLSV